MILEKRKDSELNLTSRSREMVAKLVNYAECDMC